MKAAANEAGDNATATTQDSRAGGAPDTDDAPSMREDGEEEVKQEEEPASEEP